MEEIKQFFNDCMLFKYEDKQMKIIGIVAWICVIGWICLFYWVFLNY